jgi:hypothetical protein
MRLLLGTPPQRPVQRRLGGLGASLLVHAAGALLLGVLGSRLVPAAARGGAAEPTVVVVPAARAPSPVSVDQPLVADPVQIETHDDPPPLELAGLRFRLDRIRARQESLFPFLTADLSFLARLEKTIRSATRAFVNPHSRGRRLDPLRPPLALSAAALQAIVDRAWSRQDRWRSFGEIAALVRAHDPDEGDVPRILRRYLDENVLQPYYDGRGRDPRFWVMLGLSADHIEFIDFVNSYARRYPSSRTTTELLFLLDELVQGSRDALLTLLATDPHRDLEYTRSIDRDAHELALAIRRYYVAWLKTRGLDSPDTIRMQYDQLRLRLLSTVIESTPDGYRSADARFLAGEIFFRQGSPGEARRWWQAITPDPGDAYFEAYSELLQEIQTPLPTGFVAKVIAILSGEHGRWIERSRLRLRRFGYTFDTF